MPATPKPLIDIRPDHWAIVRDILQRHVPKYEVWAFGSRTKWTAKEYSDLDLAAITDQPLSLSVSAALADDFSESDLPFKVDVVDWAATSASFREVIRRDRVVVQEARSSAKSGMAGDGWVRMPLGEFVTLQRGHDLPDEQRRPGRIPILGSFGITGWHHEAKARGPGVTVGRSGASFGVASFSTIDYWPLNTALYVVDFHGNDERFAYYFLKLFDFRSYNSGSAQPSLNRNLIHPVPVDVPPIDEQRAIAHILGTLDDKIELNRRMNETLEAMARALFKSWFVDFDPVRAKAEDRDPGLPKPLADLFPDSFEDSELGEIPKGWKVKTADDAAIVGIGKTPPRKEHHWFSEEPTDVPWMSIRDLGEAGVFISHTSEFLTTEAAEKFRVKRIPDDTVVLSFKLTMGRVAITDGEMLSNEAIAHFRLKPETSFGSAYLYCYLKGFGYDQLGSTSSIATAINSDMVRGIRVLVPPKPIAEAFERTVKPLFTQMKNIQHQSSTLAILRDALLPKLLSGELSVTETT